jgi:hypothetical protein
VGHPEACRPAAGDLPAHPRHRYFHGCYSLGDDQLWGVTRRRKGADHTLSALRSIRAARPDGERLYVILDNLSANKTPAIRRLAKRNKLKPRFTPTSASWANPPPDGWRALARLAYCPARCAHTKAWVCCDLMILRNRAG